MDAVKFIEGRKRMCEAHESCPDCPAFRGGASCIFSAYTSASSSEQVELVQYWYTEHPPKTRQSLFLEQYPEALLDANGLLSVCPAPIFHSHRSDCGGCIDYHRNCADCRREFWLQEIE